MGSFRTGAGKRPRVDPLGFMADQVLDQAGENFNHDFGRQRGRSFGASDFAAQDQAQLSATSLLVRTHDLQKAAGLAPANGKRADAAHEFLDPGGAFRREQADRAASRDAAIMPQPTASPCRYFAIGRGRLERVRERMAEIEDFAQPGFAFVG